MIFVQITHCLFELSLGKVALIPFLGSSHHQLFAAVHYDTFNHRDFLKPSSQCAKRKVRPSGQLPRVQAEILRSVNLVKGSGLPESAQLSS